jgi:hypothetical protein
MTSNRYIVIKLISSEEIVAHLIDEDDYQVKVLFPMIVKHHAMLTQRGPAESIVMAPYTYFASDDEYAFQRNQIIFIKDLDDKYQDEYNRAVDDFIALHSETPEPPPSVEELQQLTDKLNNLFRNRIEEDNIDDLPSIHVDASKTIH